MEINITEYLGEEEIREICKEEIRRKIRKSFGDKDLERLIGNSAYTKAYDLIEEHITDEHKKEIAKKTNEIINDIGSYEIFRYDYFTKKPESTASRIVDDVVKENKELIKEKVNEVITEKLSTENVYDELIERIIDGMYNGFSIKFGRD